MRNLYNKALTICMFTGMQVKYIGLRASIIFNIGCSLTMTVILFHSIASDAFWYHIPFLLLMLTVSNIRSIMILHNLYKAEKEHAQAVAEANINAAEYEEIRNRMGGLYEKTRRTHMP